MMERWRQIESVFNEALRRDPAEREAYVREACRDDSDLRCEVASLLANHSDSADLKPWAAAAAVQLIAEPASLHAGQRLGPYEILAPIGKGGMGEVYKARDTRLKRDVAVKICSARFSERFEREARAIAALNHPNICQIYDVGPNYLVMELVEGENLSGPLPLETALTYARQIAEALEVAHEKGIVHRDLKPANVKITQAGVAKVLDFGLAKAAEESTANTDAANSPTLTMSPTRTGVILGTAAYMSPEQARGAAVDKRADIWAFGCVLYEMLTGKLAFHGETTSDILAAVLKEEPDWSRIPARVRPLLRRCLVKDPKRRLRDIGDAMGIIENAPEGAPARSRLWPLAVAAVLAIVLAVIATFAWWRATRPVDHPLVRLDVDLGPDISLPAPSAAGSSVIISPDGTRLVYLASVSGGQPRLFTRRLDQRDATELPGTVGARAPFFSPDGRWVGFNVASSLNKISVEGGAVVQLANNVELPGASWGDDDGIVIAHRGRGLVRIPSGGGGPKPVTELSNGERTHAYPQNLAGRMATLFESRPAPGPGTAEIEVVSLTDRRMKTLIRGGNSPHYLTGGYLLYLNKGTLFAVPFDLDTLETRGSAVPILDDVEYSPSGSGEFDVSRNGTLVYRRGDSSRALPMMNIQWLDRVGKKEQLLAKPAVYRNLCISPDGKKLALAINERGSSQDIWVYDMQRDMPTRLTAGGSIYFAPFWSPDGQYVVFGAQQGGIFWTYADGRGRPQPLIPGSLGPGSFAPDGKRLVYIDVSGVVPQFLTAPLEEEGGQLKAGKPEEFVKLPPIVGSTPRPMFSPDGQWVTYQKSDTSGKTEIYVRPFPPPGSGQGGQWQVSNNGGTAPVWSRGSPELLYWSANQIMAVSYTVKGDSFVAEKPRVWASNVDGQQFDLAPDGKRVAVLTPVETPEKPKAEHEVVFLLNFSDYLRQRVPAGGK